MRLSNVQRNLLPILGTAIVVGCGSAPDEVGLAISQEFNPPRPFGIEGTASEVTVRGEDGGGFHVEPKQVSTERYSLIDTSMEAGTYRITARQRDCEVPCSMGGTPGRVVISCERSVTLSNEDVALLVLVDPTGRGSCVIEDG